MTAEKNAIHHNKQSTATVVGSQNTLVLNLTLGMLAPESLFILENASAWIPSPVRVLLRFPFVQMKENTRARDEMDTANPSIGEPEARGDGARGQRQSVRVFMNRRF